VSRWLAGGQGIRARDAEPMTAETIGNCCFPCLESVTRVAETVWHVLFECPNTAPARHIALEASITAHCEDEFFLHRSWPQLRAIRHWIVAAEALHEGTHAGLDREDLVDKLWAGPLE
jgi:hypothetical protein